MLANWLGWSFPSNQMRIFSHAPPCQQSSAPRQRPPTLSAMEISFKEDNFSVDPGRGSFEMTQAYYIYCALYF